MSAIDTPEARKWVRRIERVLRDCPPDIGLVGMDDCLQVVDLAAFRHEMDTAKYDAYLGTLREDAWASIKCYSAYIDSGGW